MRRALLLGLVLSGCFAAPPPPQPVYPTYDEMAWQQYCQDLRARGYIDTPNGDCRRHYDEALARQQNYNAATARRARLRDALSNTSLSKSNSTHVSCTSNKYGSTVYTDCN